MILHIGMLVDESYAVPALVTLRSLLAHLDPPWRARLHCAPNGLSPAFRAALEELLEVHWVNFEPRGSALKGGYPVQAYGPLVLADAVPSDVDRLLFLDADVLVLTNVAELTRVDFAGRALAAVRDMAIPRVSSPRGVRGWRARGLPCDAAYFNAGVLWMNLEAWREQEVSRRTWTYLNTEAVDFLHQDALNAVLCNQWVQLPLRWNLIASLAGRSFYSPAWRHDDYQRALARPGVLHFAGCFKPWLARTGSPFDVHYRQFLEPGWRPAGWRGRALGFYDRFFRRWLYRAEQWVWQRQILS